MGKIFKRTLATFMVVLIVLTCAPLGGFVGMEWEAFAADETEFISLEDTTYGVIDQNVKAKRLKLSSSFYLASHDESNNSTIGEGYAIVKDSKSTGSYLVGTEGIIKHFDSVEMPKFTRFRDYSLDYPYDVYFLNNPDTGRWDVYNASTNTYYPYALDRHPYNLTDEFVGLYLVSKNEKYGVLNSKGEMIYIPEFDDITEYNNCLVGSTTREYTDEYGETSEISVHTVLSKDGSSLQNVFYKSISTYEEVVDYSSHRNEVVTAVQNTDGYWAIISVDDLNIVTEFKYNYEHSYMKSQKYNGHIYTIGEYTIPYEDEFGYEDEYERQEIIRDDGVKWDVCTKYNGVSSTSIFYNGMLATATNLGQKVFNDRYYEGGSYYKWLYNYSYTTPDGKTQFYSGSDDLDWIGYYNGVKVVENYTYRENEYPWYYDALLDSNNKILCEKVTSVTLSGNYVIYHDGDTKKYNVYDTKNKNYMFKDLYKVSGFNDVNLVCIAEKENGKFGLLNTVTGGFTSYIFDEKISEVTELTNSRRKAYFIDGLSNFLINDKMEIISSEMDDVKTIGENLLISTEHNSDKRIIVDYDGTLVTEFVSSQGLKHISNACYLYEYVNNQKIYGLVDGDGKKILDSNLELDCTGNTYNGLTYIIKILNGYDYYSGIVDLNGNALIYGEFDLGAYYNKNKVNTASSSIISFTYGEYLYFYDLSKCAGNYEVPDSSIVTQDDLFGEYNSFLKNNYYSSICETAENDIVNTLSKQGHSAQVVSFAKSALSGGPGYVLNKLWNLLPFNSSDESKLQQELALEYLEHMDSDVMEDLVADVSKAKSLSKKIIKTQTEIKKLTESSKVSLAKTWKSEAFTESELYKFLTLVEKNEKTINAFFDKTGRTISVIDFIITYLTVCTIQQGVTERMMQLIDKNTDLYQGLKRINYQQKNGFYLAHVLVTDILSDECLGYVAGIAEKGVLELVTGKYASLVSIALSFAGKILASVIDAPDLKDTEKATMALANCASLKKAIKNYRTVIKNNYEQKGSLDVETLKTNYSLLCSSYFRALLTGLECARSVTDTRLEYDHITNTYYESNRRLIYRSYIRTCLLNARSSWEYTVQENKAVISKLNAAYPGNAGRVPLEELIEISADSSPDYTIDIPEKIDGYTVSEIGSGAFASDDKISGVYVSENVETIQSKAFDDCGSLTSLLLNDSVKTIENEALKDCSAIHSIDIPYSATNISSNFFTNEYTTITVNSSNESILSKFSDSDKIGTQRKEAQLSKLEIISEPKVKKINMQDEIETTGLKLKATYENGKTETVTEGYQCDIAERKVGSNTVTVYYKDLTADFDIEILESKCSYSIKYVDSKGNEISKEKTGTATAGSTITVKVPEIKGYIPVSEETKEKIGYKNEYTVHYKPSEKVSIEGAKVTVADQNFANKYLTPDIKVALNGQILEKDVDYTVSYSNNYNPGIADVIVFGTGIYDGVALANFEIKSVAHTHSYTSETTKAATYTATGVKTYTCSVCGESYTKTIAKKSLGTTSKITTTQTTSSVTLKWNKVTGASGYRIYRKTSDGWETIGYTTQLTYTEKGLKANTKYTYAVKAYALDGKTKVYAPKYKSIEVTTSKASLGTTSSITTTQTTSSVTLKWNKVTGASGYRIFQKVDGKWKTLTDTANLTYTVKSLKANTKYDFAVRAYVLDGKTKVLAPKYKSVSATTSKSGLGTTSKITATKTSSTVKLTWNKVSGATGYRVYQKTASGWKTLANTTKLTYTIKSLKANTSYTFAIRAYVTKSGKTTLAPKYKSLAVTTANASSKPGQVKNVKATPTATTVKLTWSKVSGVKGYYVFSYNSKTKKYTSLGKTTGTSYTVKKLKANTAYQFAVQAYKVSGGKNVYGKASSVVKVTTQLAAPTVKISSTKGKANLTWNNIAGESGYDIYMATSKNGKYTHLANYKANSTKATKSKLKSGKTYYFKVRAYKKANGKTTYGAYSAVKSVKIK